VGSCQAPECLLTQDGASHRAGWLAADPGTAAAALGRLVSGGGAWACVLEINAWRRRRRHPSLASYRELCREPAASGPGTFGEPDSTGPEGRNLSRPSCGLTGDRDLIAAADIAARAGGGTTPAIPAGATHRAPHREDPISHTNDLRGVH
jgi:hypothetical protein